MQVNILVQFLLQINICNSDIDNYTFLILCNRCNQVLGIGINPQIHLIRHVGSPDDDLVADE